MKDSHGLFDYESTQVINKVITITDKAKLIRTSQDVTVAEKNLQIDREDKTKRGLLNIGILKNNYWVYGLANTFPNEEDLWIVLRDYKENGYPGYKLKEGLTIKMGRCRYILTELVLNEEVCKSFDNTYMEPPDNNVSISLPSKLKWENQSEDLNSEKRAEEMTCRICLVDKSTPENLLIESPCSCTGSIRFIHVTCLKYWLKSKVNERRTNYSATYTWKDFECEVCKKKYPSKLVKL